MNKISQLNYNGTKVLAKYPMGVYNAIRKIPLGGIKRQNKEFVEILVIYARACLAKGGIIRMENENTCHCCKKKDRSDKERKDLMNRLSRIEGQIRGIKGMVEKDCYCPDIITQVAAANAALNSFNKVLLAEHIRTCVADGIRNGEDDKVDELVAMLQKLMK